VTTPRYDRAAATRILAGLAGDRLFAGTDPGGPRVVGYTAHRLTPEPGRHLTLSQRLYLEKFMRPCPPEQVSSATHRITWTDTTGVPCTGHYTDGGLGPQVPIAVRETTLALWRQLAGDTAFAERIAELGPAERAVLAGTTTDQQPDEIFRIGVEAAGRTLAQHALVAAAGTAADFAAAMRDGGVFAVVAGQWYWELQASTFRRGMIPVRFADRLPLRYTPESLDVLRRMKDATIADAHAVMLTATTVEGLTEEAAVRKYHDDLDLISRQYALLPPGVRPRCLAQNTIIPGLVDAFVDTFVQVLSLLTVGVADREPGDDEDGTTFYVPDMNCRHCQATIRGVLESMDLTVHEVDLVGKRVSVADFRSPRNRRRALDAVRDAGYTALGSR
jgi:copper chaperone CopZ